jgi:D-arabinose 1-dehydrogenase-like Zn-dependent alcohol dehydrogenase
VAPRREVKATIELQSLESINEVFGRLKRGRVNSRIVLAIGDEVRRELTATASRDAVL